MRKGLKVTGIVFGVFVLVAGLWVTNNFIYPFSSSNPNYADVERAFAKLQFPSDWQEVSSSENRGLHGRGCDPLNDSGCFSKSKIFKVDKGVTIEEVKSVMVASALCTSVTVNSTEPIGADAYSNANCSVENGTFSLMIRTTMTFGADSNEVSIGVDTLR